MNLFKKYIVSILSIGVVATGFLGNMILATNITENNLILHDEKVKIIPDKFNIAIVGKNPEMCRALQPIWKDAFNISYMDKYSEYGDFYINNIFNTYTTFVYVHEGMPISMATLIPTSLVSNGQKIEGYYVYAVGTCKKYEGNGIATMLLEYIDEYSKANGRNFRILIPDSKHSWLYDFYGKRGYETVYSRRTYMNSNEMESFAGDVKGINYKIGISEDLLKRCRNDNYAKHTGFVEWDEPELVNVQKEYGLINSKHKAIYFGDSQYAIINMKYAQKYNIIHIREFNIREENKKGFIRMLLNSFPDSKFVFDMPDKNIYSNFFGKECYRIKSSMINFKGSEDIKMGCQQPFYFNFGLDT